MTKKKIDYISDKHNDSSNDNNNNDYSSNDRC